MLNDWFSTEKGGPTGGATWWYFPKRQAHAASSQEPTEAAQEAPMEQCELHRSKSALVANRIFDRNPIICSEFTIFFLLFQGNSLQTVIVC